MTTSTIPAPATHLAPYHTDLMEHGRTNPDRHRDETNRDQDAHWYGALIADKADINLDPRDDENDFFPAIDVSYGEIATRVAHILDGLGTVVPRQMAEDEALDHQPDELAALARNLELVSWKDDGEAAGGGHAGRLGGAGRGLCQVLAAGQGLRQRGRRADRGRVQRGRRP